MSSRDSRRLLGALSFPMMSDIYAISSTRLKTRIFNRKSLISVMSALSSHTPPARPNKLQFQKWAMIHSKQPLKSLPISYSRIPSLYSQAVREAGRDRFSVSHDELLKIFMKDLRRLATNQKLEAVRFLGKKRSRTQVTAQVLRLILLELSSLDENRETFRKFLDQPRDRDYPLHLFLSQQIGTSGSTGRREPHILGDDRDKPMQVRKMRATIKTNNLADFDN
jgi:hypothetical protein